MKFQRTPALHRILRHPTENIEHPEILNITEQSIKSWKYVILEFNGVCILFLDVFRSVYSVFSLGGNMINDEGRMARDE